MEPSEEHSGGMVLRAWLEDGKPDRLRVRVFSTVGPGQAQPFVVTSAAAVHAVVQRWLDELGATTAHPG